MPPPMTIVGIVLAALSLVGRATTVNRHVRGRLMASAALFGICAASSALTAYLDISAGLRSQLTLVQPLLLAFGIINAAVALLINPWRVDRLPDRFPTIVQDSIVIALFAVAATLVLQDRIFATTAVGAVVIGLALQDTLGNLFAGLAIQVEKPFRVGHWVNIGGHDGVVTEVTWRATKIRTRPGNFLIVPNSTVSKETITNYSEPTQETRIEVPVGAGYETPPNEVKRVVVEALRNEPLLALTRAPEVLLMDFGASALIYRVLVWTRDFGADELIHDRVRCAVYYAFRRSGISIPYPIQVELSKEELETPPPARTSFEEALRRVQIFSPLSDDERAQLAAAARHGLYAEREAVVREGEPGSSMFVVIRGEVVVSIGSGEEVARAGPGGFFGEMSLLTGAPRTATVTAACDTDLLEITAEAFREVVLANPAALERVSEAVAARAAQLAERRAGGAAQAPLEPPFSLAARIRRFLRLS
jgi:small-conductance mechanosensitive channel